MARRRRLAHPAVEDQESRVDLTPMIDMVFLLLVFFILTTTFLPEDRQLAALLPQSGSGTPPPDIIPPATVRIAIVPVGLPERASEVAYEAEARALRGQERCREVALRMGTQVLGHIDLDRLRSADNAIALTELDRVHALLHAALRAREMPVQWRSDAPPVEIHAWSGLPWASVTTVFDAIRDYEAIAHGSVVSERKDLSTARQVSFAAPPLRNASTKSDGRELFDLMHLL